MISIRHQHFDRLMLVLAIVVFTVLAGVALTVQ